MIKVKATIKKDLRTSKRELGSFCAQYGYEKILHPSTKQEKYYSSNRKRLNKKYLNFKEEQYFKKSKHKKHSNKTHQTYSRKTDKKKKVKCFKCGKKGHIAPNYRVKEIIANLDIGKHLKE